MRGGESRLPGQEKFTLSRSRKMRIIKPASSGLTLPVAGAKELTGSVTLNGATAVQVVPANSRRTAIYFISDSGGLNIYIGNSGVTGATNGFLVIASTDIVCLSRMTGAIYAHGSNTAVLKYIEVLGPPGTNLPAATINAGRVTMVSGVTTQLMPANSKRLAYLLRSLSGTHNGSLKRSAADPDGLRFPFGTHVSGVDDTDAVFINIAAAHDFQYLEVVGP